MRKFAVAIAGAIALSGVVALTGAAAAPTTAPKAVAGRLLALHTAASAASTQTVGIRMVDIPADQANNPIDREYIVDHMHPGTTITRQVEIVNNTSTTQVVQVYAAAASISGGTIHFGPGHAVNQLTTWTTVSPSTVRPLSGGDAIATVKIAVPPTAPAGEQYAVVWAQLAPAVPVGGGVTTINRVGVRVYLSVGAGGDPPSNFSITAVQAKRAANGTPELAATVHNTGGLPLDLSGTLKLTDGPGGLSAGPFAADLGTTLGLGQAEPVLVPLNKAIPSGPWHVSMTLTSGLTVRSATATVTFPAASGTSAAVVKTSSSGGGLGLYLALGGVVVLLVLIFLALLFRRRRDRAQLVH